MPEKHPGPSGASVERGRLAEQRVAAMFEEAGWHVDRSLRGRFAPDLVIRRGETAYAVEIKAASEARGDRLIPLLSQAVLHVLRTAGENVRPLAIIVAPRIPSRIADQLLGFARDYVDDVAIGVVDAEGLRRFSEPPLNALDTDPASSPRNRSPVPRSALDAPHLFTDLNQWMLKVLLAPEIPDHLLRAVRSSYRNASQLAQAAQVSVMSAFRLVQQLKKGGYLDESSRQLQLVRRRDLFARWLAAADRPHREANMRLRLPGDPERRLRNILAGRRACLGLFSAARNLGLGFVEGAPPHVYVDRVQPSTLAAWRDLRPCEPGESADIVLRQADAPESVFRAMVTLNGLASCDILQTWLDVAAHPTRGAEQARLIRDRVLAPVIEKEAEPASSNASLGPTPHR